MLRLCLCADWEALVIVVAYRFAILIPHADRKPPDAKLRSRYETD
jgi:hypothetical protein